MTINWWTLGIQTVNVGILVWLLGRFFWKPLAALIETRRGRATSLLTDAAAIRAKADAELAEIDKTRAGFAAERDAILATARADAEKAETTTLAAAALEATALRAAAEATLDRDREAIDAACGERAGRLAIDIATRLANRLEGSAVEAAFLDWLLQAIRALPATTRLTVSTGDGPLDVTSAGVLPADKQDRYRGLIGDAFGGHPRLRFTTDAALVRGLELRGATLVLRNSWRADLARISAELTHDHGR